MFTLAVTDLSWHRQLLEEPVDDFINFWTPTLWKPRLELGSRFLFLLKAPIRKVGGFGTFREYSEMRASEAWGRFGPGNGARSLDDLVQRIRGFAGKRSKKDLDADPTIGCIVLGGGVFLTPDMQCAPSALGIQFPAEVVKYKKFAGEMRLPFEAAYSSQGSAFQLVGDDASVDYADRRTKKRLGCAEFRDRILEVYEGRCAITGVDCRTALDAAHIQPFKNLASNHTQNGIALRKDIHALFDSGLIGLSDELRVMVNPALGQEYRRLEGAPLRLPVVPWNRPSRAAVRAHRTLVYEKNLPRTARVSKGTQK